MIERQGFTLSVTDGSIQNPGGAPLRAAGTMQVKAEQPGRGADFHLLNGVVNGDYPAEIVASDSPMGGELWRILAGTGATPTTGMFVACDDSGQAWLHVGTDQSQAAFAERIPRDARRDEGVARGR